MNSDKKVVKYNNIIWHHFYLGPSIKFMSFNCIFKMHLLTAKVKFLFNSHSSFILHTYYKLAFIKGFR